MTRDINIQSKIINYEKLACFLKVAFKFIACDVSNIENILPLLDQAIMELFQDDVSATLEVALPSCGDINRDGLIDLDVST